MMSKHINYGSPSASTGFFISQRLSTDMLAGSSCDGVTRVASSASPRRDEGAGAFLLKMPIRKQPNERVSSIIAIPRSRSSHWTVRMHLFGCEDDPHNKENWFGPLDRQSSASTGWGYCTKKIKTVPNGASTVWYQGQAIQFDTQDYSHSAIVTTIVSTPRAGGTWTSHCGMFVDVFVQEATP